MSSPGDVAAVLGEVDRRAEVRRPVHAVDEPVDDIPRHQLEVADARQHDGIDEPRAGNRRDLNMIVSTASSVNRRVRRRGLHSRSRHRHRFEQSIDQRVARDAFRLRVEVGQHAVPQHGMRQRPDVVEAHVIAAARERARLARRAPGTAPRGRWRRTPPTS